MGYLGNTPAESFLSFEKQVFTIVNSQTAYTLNFSVTNENDIRLVINNIIQEPGTGKAYTASGTTLTLSAALTNGTDEMYCVFLGRARETVTVPDIQTGNIADDAVTKAKVNFISDSTAGVEVKGDGGSNDGYIQLNCRVNSHGIKLKSPPHSAGQSYTMVYPTTNITAGKFLKVDSVSGSGATGIGQLSFADAGGTWVKLAETDISSSTSEIVVNNLFTSDYTNYQVYVTGLNVTSQAQMYGRVYIGGSESGSSLYYSAKGGVYGDSSGSNTTKHRDWGASNFMVSSWSLSTGTYDKSNFIFDIFDPLNANSRPMLASREHIVGNNFTQVIEMMSTYYYNDNTAISGFKLSMASGNFANAKIIVWGIKD
tara:strand:- start:801 stop:1910 length:1110 start_codon:yes stop_codon:yes gene_type:complete